MWAADGSARRPGVSRRVRANADRSAGSGNRPARRVVVLAAAGLALACGTGLGACGGSSNISDAIPKSTPEITPPTNTSIERQATQTTSTSAVSTGSAQSKASSESAPSSSGAASEPSSQPAGSSSAGAGASEPSSHEVAGGTSAGATSNGGGTGNGGEEAAKGESKESSPTGGAGAP